MGTFRMYTDGSGDTTWEPIDLDEHLGLRAVHGEGAGGFEQRAADRQDKHPADPATVPDQDRQLFDDRWDQIATEGRSHRRHRPGRLGGSEGAVLFEHRVPGAVCCR